MTAAEKTVRAAFDEFKRGQKQTPERWRSLLKEAEDAYFAAFGDAEDRQLAEEFVGRIMRHNEREWRRNHADELEEDDTGLNLSPETVHQALIDQVDAMRTLIREYYRRLQRAGEGKTGILFLAALGAAMVKEAGISKRKANFYGRDQTGNVNEAVSEERLRNQGYEWYEWLRTTAAHPRERHLKRVGKIYHIDDPPEGGHPGTEHNCQCGMRGVDGPK